MGAGATVANALGAAIRNKWLAHHLEASGLGVLAQVLSCQSWLGTAAGLGLGFPLARAVGAASASEDRTAARRTVWAALVLFAAATTALVTAGLLFAAPISTALLGSPAYAGLVRISMIGVAGIALQQNLVGLFAGRSDLRGPLVVALAGGGVATAAVFLLVPRFGLRGGVLAVAILFPVGCAAALYARRREYAPLALPPPRPLVTGTGARELLTIAAAGLVASLLDQGVFLALRAHYVRANGVAANGLLQAAVALAQQMGALFYAYLASYAFGKMSGIVATGGEDRVERARAYTRKHWTPILLTSGAALGFAMIAAVPLLRLLYSHRFDAARPLMAWALAGEFARVALQLWILSSLPLGGARLWFPISVVFPPALVASYAWFTHEGMGVLTLPRAYAAAGLVSALVGGAVMWRRGITLGPKHAAVFAGALLALFLLAGWIGR